MLTIGGRPAASSSPAVLVAHLAAATATIRVGSGGVMLPIHAPLVVAEQDLIADFTGEDDTQRILATPG